jgi:hypothetical protein
MIKSKRVWWAGHVENVEEKRRLYRFGVGKIVEKKSLEDRVVDGRIILK